MASFDSRYTLIMPVFAPPGKWMFLICAGKGNDCHRFGLTIRRRGR